MKNLNKEDIFTIVWAMDLQRTEFERRAIDYDEFEETRNASRTYRKWALEIETIIQKLRQELK